MPVTLLTDFGTRDHFVAAMKGVILARAPDVALVDVTHEVPPQDVAAAAFLLLAAYRAFPAGTVHLAVVDPGVGSARRPLAVAAAGQRFVGPDNGIFSHVLDREPGARVFHLDDARAFRHPVSHTFHGRDVFAPVAGALAAGADPAELGTEVRDPVRLEPIGARRTAEGAVEGTVLHVDHFGNCITSVAADDVPEGLGEGFRLRLGGGEVRALRTHYAGAAPGEPFAIWGSAGFLEVSVNGASAARRLGVRRGDAVTLAPGERAGDPLPGGRNRRNL
ncbi:MAG TPA: SAM-dependent chlorinase/fluorinase [Longimicrobiaceae bacterium]|nr:SAM-dependent chlorinase/fluorinase [Longimicrobiaceae bacterium]